LREVDLLDEAGFTPLEAIKIASFNGAKLLGEVACRLARGSESKSGSEHQRK
jgi:hypothetical protein